MTARKAKTADPFPELVCAACRFCRGERDEWKCWAQPPRHLEPEELGPNRSEPIEPTWPACFMFIARTN